ncbi:hypothetical protein PG991_009097 [Apiospora marii]|uniref:Uncharacterized protein n=1 Tax=Apiospora marii TaxID=335849 RepID=A0ABR1RLU4_9PEZI
MASVSMAPVSREEVSKAIREKGYWILDDASVGPRVGSLLKDGFELQNIEALDLLDLIFERQQQVLDAIDDNFAEPVLGYFRAWGLMKQHHCFLNNLETPHSETSILNITLCSSNTLWDIDEGSHLHRLNATEHSSGMLGVDDNRLHELGIKSAEADLKHGGFIVHDGRTSFRIHRGKVLFAGVMTPAEAMEWHPMPLPKTEPFADKIAKLKGRNQGFVRKFVWEAPVSEDGNASGSKT